jgi:hypothetical protein
MRCVGLPPALGDPLFPNLAEPTAPTGYIGGDDITGISFVFGASSADAALLARLRAGRRPSVK